MINLILLGGGYDTRGKCTPPDVESRLTKALATSDKYVVFYSDSSLASCGLDNRWLDVSTPVDSVWLQMIQRVFDGIQMPTPVPHTIFYNTDE